MLLFYCDRGYAVYTRLKYGNVCRVQLSLLLLHFFTVMQHVHSIYIFIMHILYYDELCNVYLFISHARR